jgi:hypothetical protein
VNEDALRHASERLAMSEAQSRVRTVVVVYVPLFIAVLSLVTSIYNGYLNNKFVEIIQRNFERGESLRTCKEIIEAYFQVKFRTGIVSENGERERASGSAVPGAEAAQTEAMHAVNKVGALGTYLANMEGEAARARYTNLTWELEKIVKEAPRLAVGNLAKRFEPADKLFGGMNADCVRNAKE